MYNAFKEIAEFLLKIFTAEFAFENFAFRFVGVIYLVLYGYTFSILPAEIPISVYATLNFGKCS